MLRPGKRVELVEARMTAQGRAVVVARAWRIQAGPGSSPQVALAEAVPPTLPQAQPQFLPPGVGPDWGYGRSIEWRFVEGDMRSPGPVSVWARPLLPLVAGERSTGLDRTLVVIDSINGLSAELDLGHWLFVPPGLTLTATREAVGEWVHVAARTVISGSGTGVAQATVVTTTEISRWPPTADGPTPLLNTPTAGHPRCRGSPQMPRDRFVPECIA